MIPWPAIGIVALSGSLTLLCGLFARAADDVDGERRIMFGGGALGAALVLTIANAIHGYGKIAGWW